MCMVKFGYEQEDRRTQTIALNISYVHCKNTMYWNLKHGQGKDIIQIFIKAVMFHHLNLSCLIQSNGKIKMIMIVVFHIVFQLGLSKIQKSVPIYANLLLNSYFLLYINIYMIYHVLLILMKHKMKWVVIMWEVGVKEHIQRVQELICCNLFVLVSDLWKHIGKHYKIVMSGVSSRIMEIRNMFFKKMPLAKTEPTSQQFKKNDNFFFMI